MRATTIDFKQALMPIVLATFTALAVSASMITQAQNILDVQGLNWRIGGGVDGSGKPQGDLRAKFLPNDNSALIVEGYGSTAQSGMKLSYHLASTENGFASALGGVQKFFVAADRNREHHAKFSLGLGGENGNWFWGAYGSKRLSGDKVIQTLPTVEIVESAYDWGVGLRVGTFIDDALLRVTGGLDYERGIKGYRCAP